jgi:23S rRNA pseudouridine2605 synthase
MGDESELEGEIRKGQRIAKVMARAGVCSRRDAEAWIAEGRVSVNGKVLSSPAFNVAEDDDVRVDGEPLAARERTRLFLFHKPRGVVTTARDPEGRRTIFDALPEGLPRLIAVGRLDINTEGLLLLTNDGGLARVLELPATGWLRRYRVRAHGSIDQERLDQLSEGITLDGVDYMGIEARLDREQGSNAWMTLGLREGKNREIKKVLEHLGLAVNRLIRVSFGPFELGDLPEGEAVEIRTRVLREQLGVKLAREAGADFDAPIVARETPPAEGDGRRAPDEASRKTRGSPSRADERRRPRAADDTPPRVRRDGPSAPQRRRKHVSALRAEIAADATTRRRRIERTATHDRKGRTIAVERMSATREEAAGRAPDETRPKRAMRRKSARSGENGGPRRPRPFEAERSRDGDRHGRRFEDRPERSGDARGRSRHAGDRDKFARERDFERPRGARRGPGAEDGASRPDRRDAGPRADFKPRWRGRAEGPGSDRAEGRSHGERPGRPARGREESTERPQRRFDRPRGPRRETGGERAPSRRPGGPPGKGRPRGGGGPRRPPDKP